MTVKPLNWQKLYEPKYGKPVKVIVWKNRDFDTPGQEITLHPKFLRSWNAALEYITFVLQPRWGAVRKLVHLETKKILLCLQEIQQNEKYVAVGSDKFKFKKDGYKLVPHKDAKSSKHYNNNELFFENNIKDLEDFMSYTKKKKRTVIYFMVSGRSCQIPIKVVLIEHDLMDHTMILDYLAHRLDIGEGIQSLCTINGKIIENLSELRHGKLYIAVPHGTDFIELNYKELFKSLLPERAKNIDDSTTLRTRLLDRKKSNKRRKRSSSSKKGSKATSEDDDDPIIKENEISRENSSNRKIEKSKEKLTNGAEKKSTSKIRVKSQQDAIKVKSSDMQSKLMMSKDEERSEEEFIQTSSNRKIETSEEKGLNGAEKKSTSKIRVKSSDTQKSSKENVENEAKKKSSSKLRVKSQQDTDVNGKSSATMENKQVAKIKTRSLLPIIINSAEEDGIIIENNEVEEEEEDDDAENLAKIKSTLKKHIQIEEDENGEKTENGDDDDDENDDDYNSRQSAARGVLQFKCISDKCIDNDCRLLRKEYMSLPASFFQIATSDESETANWDNYTFDLQQKIDEIVTDVNTVRSLLNNMVDETILQVKHRGIATPAFIKSSDSVDEKIELGDGAELLHFQQPKADKKTSSKNLTTFAEIAKNKSKEISNHEVVEPIFAFDLPQFRYNNNNAEDTPDDPQQINNNNLSRMSGMSRKGVSFMSIDNPDIIYDPPKAQLLSTTSFSPSLMPKISILKPSEMSLIDDPRQSPSIIPEKAVPCVVKESFLKLRNSITDDYKATDFKRRLSELYDKGVDLISDENINISYSENDEDNDEDFDDDQDDNLFTSSKGIQKNWEFKNDEQQGVDEQVQADIKNTLNQIFDHSTQTNKNNSRSNNNKNFYDYYLPH